MVKKQKRQKGRENLNSRQCSIKLLVQRNSELEIPSHNEAMSWFVEAKQHYTGLCSNVNNTAVSVRARGGSMLLLLLHKISKCMNSLDTAVWLHAWLCTVYHYWCNRVNAFKIPVLPQLDIHFKTFHTPSSWLFLWEFNFSMNLRLQFELHVQAHT